VFIIQISNHGFILHKSTLKFNEENDVGNDAFNLKIIGYEASLDLLNFSPSLTRDVVGPKFTTLKHN
jgi:hypothetical protein